MKPEEFVITLRSVPQPISIPRPQSRHLAHLSFFSTRRQDVSDESYWVHLGHFTTRAEAERWLKMIRSDYPAARVSDLRSLEAAPQSEREAALNRTRSSSRESGALHDAPGAGRVRDDAFTDEGCSRIRIRFHG